MKGTLEGLLRGEACPIPEEQNEETVSEEDEGISVEEVQKAINGGMVFKMGDES